MTASDYRKILKQLKNKPGKKKKWEKHNTPKPEHEASLKKCAISGRTGGHISKYGLGICRQEFRENAEELGFRKYN